MSRLTAFVPPTPNRLVQGITSVINRTMIVGGMPVLKHISGFRPLTRIVSVDFPETHQHMMRALCQPGRATFFAPNHPEFFTDWMVDKHLLDRVAPRAASWATHGIVNGMGAMMQRYWLANNLIAQIPGGGSAARKYSTQWAAAGHGVLLHPEGHVGWHMEEIAPVFSGAVEMALDSLESSESVTEAYVLPMVWRPVFTGDVTLALFREYRYICSQLDIVPWGDLSSPAEGVHHIYSTLVGRVEHAFLGDSTDGQSFRVRHTAVLELLRSRIIAMMGDVQVGDNLLRSAHRFLRQNPQVNAAPVRQYELMCRIGDFAWRREQMTQEEVSEHFKRLRTDYCHKGFRNTLHRYVPRAVGARRAYIRMCDPIALHGQPGSRSDVVRQAVALLQERLQLGTETLRQEVQSKYQAWYKNPFF